MHEKTKKLCKNSSIYQHIPNELIIKMAKFYNNIQRPILLIYATLRSFLVLGSKLFDSSKVKLYKVQMHSAH